MKQKIIPIVSALVGLLAFILTYQYLKGQRDEVERVKAMLYAGAKKISVMVPRKDIPRGTTLVSTDLTVKDIPAASASDQFVVHEDGPMLLNKKTTRLLKAEGPILWSDIEGGTPPVQGLSASIQPGLRAVSIAVSGANSVSGMVEPNDRVDVLGTYSFPSKTTPGEMETVTLTLLQDVTVLATGQNLAKQEFMRNRNAMRSTSYSTVTLEVTPQEAEFLVFAQQAQGRLSLVLRNPTDAYYKKDLPEINFKYLESELPKMNLYRQKEIRRRSGL